MAVRREAKLLDVQSSGQGTCIMEQKRNDELVESRDKQAQQLALQNAELYQARQIQRKLEEKLRLFNRQTRSQRFQPESGLESPHSPPSTIL